MNEHDKKIGVRACMTTTLSPSWRAAVMAAATTLVASELVRWLLRRRPGLLRRRSNSVDMNDMNTINRELMLRGHALRVRRTSATTTTYPTDDPFSTPTRSQLRNVTPVVRIALTGGPCAGKSSALSHLCRAATEEGFDVLTAPEVATLFFNCGYQFPSPNSPTFEEQKLEFQKQNLELQLGLEKSVNALAASTGRPTIVVFDRGMMDPKAYLSAERWEQAVRELARAGSLPTDKVHDAERFMNDKYDGCIHLVTAADGAPGFYK